MHGLAAAHLDDVLADFVLDPAVGQDCAADRPVFHGVFLGLVDPGDVAAGQPDRLKNIVQLFDETVIVSDTAQVVDAAGRSNELKYQVAKSGKALKRDIERVGTWKGHNLYSYRYLWDNEPQFGVMAD